MNFGDETVTVCPEGQHPYSEEQLATDITICLHPVNPEAKQNTTKFDFVEQVWKTEVNNDHLIVVCDIQPSINHKDSKNYAAEQEFLAKMKETRDALAAAAEAAGEEEVEIADVEGEVAVKNTLRNQFNFSERASQTVVPVLKSRAVATLPPRTQVHQGDVCQHMIFDAYIEDARKQAESARKEEEGGDYNQEPEKKMDAGDAVYSEAMKFSTKLMERTVNLQVEMDIYHDYRYWEDRSDEFQEQGMGTLLPLWKLSEKKTKGKSVTCISWHPHYPDLVAVGYGSYDFLRQGEGVICIYSIKNSGYPEYIYNIPKSAGDNGVGVGVCSLDWHPDRTALLAVGLYDGRCQVYDLRAKHKKSIYESSVATNQHTGAVWQVRWGDSEDGVLGFYSISSDGLVNYWKLMKDKLECEQIMELKLASSVDEEDETALTGLAGGLCFDFHKTQDFLFLVGTEEGKIHKCSKAFSGQYLETYEGHTMAVYAVKWNPFHSDIFLSCSADWTVKMWHHQKKQCILSFDQTTSVGDINWAPYSSTCFCAATTKGIVNVYDLNVNRNEPICHQKIVKKAQLCKVSYNAFHAVLVVGDDKGNLIVLKLSPNLRKDMKNQQRTDFADTMVANMKNCLEMLKVEV